MHTTKEGWRRHDETQGANGTLHSCGCHKWKVSHTPYQEISPTSTCICTQGEANLPKSSCLNYTNPPDSHLKPSKEMVTLTF